MICYLLKTINLYTGHRGLGLHSLKCAPRFCAPNNRAPAQLKAVNLAKAFSHLLIGIAVHTLLLPSYGFLLDHHLVERWPDHTHFYLGLAVPEHIHPYEVPHSHGVDGEDFSRPDLPPDGIVYFSSHAAAQVFAFSLTPPIHADLIFSYSGAHEDPFGRVEAEVRFAQSAFIPSPKKPPRV